MPNEPQRRQRIFLVCLAMLPFLQTIRYEYVLDDSVVITHNHYTQSGVAGVIPHLRHHSLHGYQQGRSSVDLPGGRYRPLSLITFSLEQQLWAAWPLFLRGFRHLVNVLVYAGIVWLLFDVSLRLKLKADVALLVAALFAVHPTHVESVANIKGRDDLLMLLFALLALRTSQSQQCTTAHVVKLGIYTALAAFAKETGVMVAPVITLLLWQQKRLSAKRATALSAWIAATIFLIARASAITASGANTELLNNPFVAATINERIGTVLMTWAWYAKLLVAPWPLTVDYYPNHVPLVQLWHPASLLGAALTVALIWLLIRKKQTLAGFATAWAVAFFLPVSNLLFTTGTLMAERFLLTPSVGLCWLLGLALSRCRKNPAALMWGVIALLAGLSTIRAAHWRDEITLLRHDVAVSHASAFSNHAIAELLLREANNSGHRNLSAIEAHLHAALQAHPAFTAARQKLMLVQYEAGKFDAALRTGRALLAASPDNYVARLHLGIWLRDAGAYEHALRHLRTVTASYPEDVEGNYHLGVSLLRMHTSQSGTTPEQLREARGALLRAARHAPLRSDIVEQLGVAQFLSGDFQGAITAWEHVLPARRSRQLAIPLREAYLKAGEHEKAAALGRQYQLD